MTHTNRNEVATVQLMHNVQQTLATARAFHTIPRQCAYLSAIVAGEQRYLLGLHFIKAARMLCHAAAAAAGEASTGW